MSRIISLRLNSSVFNTLNETFPQEERLLSNEYSINLPAKYNLKGRYRKSWINIINPFRALLVMGSPGSGKSYFIHFTRYYVFFTIKTIAMCMLIGYARISTIYQNASLQKDGIG